MKNINDIVFRGKEEIKHVKINFRDDKNTGTFSTFFRSNGYARFAYCWNEGPNLSYGIPYRKLNFNFDDDNELIRISQIGIDAHIKNAQYDKVGIETELNYHFSIKVGQNELPGEAYIKKNANETYTLKIVISNGLSRTYLYNFKFPDDKPIKGNVKEYFECAFTSVDDENIQNNIKHLLLRDFYGGRDYEYVY